MKIFQFSCREDNKIDLRQANALLRHKPSIVIWEAPSNKASASLIIGPTLPIDKQISIINERITSLKNIANKFPWVASDIETYKNAVSLIKNGHKLKMYNVDAPSELLEETIINKWNLMDKPRRRGSHLLWWVYIYLRERMMADNIKPIIDGSDQKVLIFMQKFHWLHVEFLLMNPPKNKEWQYYFGKFENVNKTNIAEILKKKNIVLYKYWMKHSHFI